MALPREKGSLKRAVSGIMLILLLIYVFALAFDIRPASAAQPVLVSEITSNNPWVYEGKVVNVNVTVSNIVGPTENAWVTLYYNLTTGLIIGAYTYGIYLDKGQNYTFSFTWNTAGIPCLNYTLTAVATTTTGLSAASNTSLTIRLLGDVNGDGRVDLKDLALVARAFGSTPTSPNWNPAADINGDGQVNMKDIALVVRNFGQQTITNS